MHPSGLFLSRETVFQEKTFQRLSHLFRQGSTFLKSFPKKESVNLKEGILRHLCLVNCFHKDCVWEVLWQNLCIKIKLACVVSCWNDDSSALFHRMATSYLRSFQHTPPQAHGSNTLDFFPTCSKGISFIWCLARYVGADFDSIFYTSIASSPIFKFQVMLKGFPFRFTTKIAGILSKLQPQYTLTLSAGRLNL